MAAERLRGQLDAGTVDRQAGARGLARLGRALLRRSPGDAELVRAFQVLRGRAFDPPRPLALPSGSWRAVWDALAALEADERATLAGTLMTLPDPAGDPAGALAVMELLATVPEQHDRARALLDRLEGHVPEARLRLWSFRLALPQTHGAEALDAALAPVLAAADSDPTAAATALRLAASAWLDDHLDEHHGWLVPVLGGRHVPNAALAARRRPALRDRLAPAYRWLGQAETLEPAADEATLDGLLLAAASHDRAGRVADATAALEQALTRSGDRPDLAEALVARGQLLLSADLVERAAARAALPVDPAMRADLIATARRPVDPPPRDPIEPPRVGWSHRVAELGGDGGARDESDLAFLEAAGSRARAAAGWLRRDDDLALLHAFRLRDALDEDGLGSLIGKLRARVPDDEDVLSDDATTRELAAALLALTPDGLSRALQSVRLRAAGGAPVPPRPPSEPEGAPEDPHSPESRLAAATDLTLAGRHDAAAAILTALLKRTPEAGAHVEGPFLARLLDATATLLAEERPPEALVAVTGKALASDLPWRDRLLDLLAARPLAAYAVHEPLARLGLDTHQPDPQRVRGLAAWLAIWRASDTPPDPVTLRDFMRADATLVALAARRLATAPDPVGDAARLVAQHPPLEASAADWAQVIAAASRPG